MARTYIQKGNPKCSLCGDSHLVLRGYIDKECGMPKAMDRVRCPRCTKPEVAYRPPGFPGNFSNGRVNKKA